MSGVGPKPSTSDPSVPSTLSSRPENPGPDRQEITKKRRTLPHPSASPAPPSHSPSPAPQPTSLPTTKPSPSASPSPKLSAAGATNRKEYLKFGVKNYDDGHGDGQDQSDTVGNPVHSDIVHVHRLGGRSINHPSAAPGIGSVPSGAEKNSRVDPNASTTTTAPQSATTTTAMEVEKKGDKVGDAPPAAGSTSTTAPVATTAPVVTSAAAVAPIATTTEVASSSTSEAHRIAEAARTISSMAPIVSTPRPTSSLATPTFSAPIAPSTTPMKSGFPERSAPPPGPAPPKPHDNMDILLRASQSAGSSDESGDRRSHRRAKRFNRRATSMYTLPPAEPSTSSRGIKRTSSNIDRDPFVNEFAREQRREIQRDEIQPQQKMEQQQDPVILPRRGSPRLLQQRAAREAREAAMTPQKQIKPHQQVHGGPQQRQVQVAPQHQTPKQQTQVQVQSQQQQQMQGPPSQPQRQIKVEEERHVVRPTSVVPMQPRQGVPQPVHPPSLGAPSPRYPAFRGPGQQQTLPPISRLPPPPQRAPPPPETPQELTPRHQPPERGVCQHIHNYYFHGPTTIYQGTGTEATRILTAAGAFDSSHQPPPSGEHQARPQQSPYGGYRSPTAPGMPQPLQPPLPPFRGRPMQQPVAQEQTSPPDSARGTPLAGTTISPFAVVGVTTSTTATPHHQEQQYPSQPVYQQPAEDQRSYTTRGTPRAPSTPYQTQSTIHADPGSQAQLHSREHRAGSNHSQSNLGLSRHHHHHHDGAAMQPKDLKVLEQAPPQEAQSLQTRAQGQNRMGPRAATVAAIGEGGSQRGRPPPLTIPVYAPGPLISLSDISPAPLSSLTPPPHGETAMSPMRTPLTDLRLGRSQMYSGATSHRTPTAQTPHSATRTMSQPSTGRASARDITPASTARARSPPMSSRSSPPIPPLRDTNDWEYVVQMYRRGVGTPDGRPLREHSKSEGVFPDRKLLEKRRTIGKTYEKLGKDLFEKAIGYKRDPVSGLRRKQRMYHVIARCRAVNAIRKAGQVVPTDPDHLERVLDAHLKRKREMKMANQEAQREAERAAEAKALAEAELEIDVKSED